MAIELPSLSKELDKYLECEIVSGEVTSEEGHFYVAFSLTSKEYANTPPTDLWSFYIAPALKDVSLELNKFAKLAVRTPELPPKDTPGLLAAFISADGKVPARMMVLKREPSPSFPDPHVLFTIDFLTQKVA